MGVRRLQPWGRGTQCSLLALRWWAGPPSPFLHHAAATPPMLPPCPALTHWPPPHPLPPSLPVCRADGDKWKWTVLGSRKDMYYAGSGLYAGFMFTEAHDIENARYVFTDPTNTTGALPGGRPGGRPAEFFGGGVDWLWLRVSQSG